MYPSKRFYCLIITAFISVSNIFAHTYLHADIFYDELQQSIENLIIRETAKSNNMPQKAVSLEYIEDSLIKKQPRDNTYFLYHTLKYLAFEGTINIIKTNNVLNDFPGIRRKAVKLLGELGIVEARIALMEVLKYETNQLVLYEASISLFFRWPNSYKKRINTISLQ
jgi:hypothetical protein